MDTKEILETLKSTFGDILKNYEAGLGNRVKETENNLYSVRLYFNGGLDGLDYDFNIEFDGTTESFAEKAVIELYNFESGECAKENINNYAITDIEDMQWYIDRAEALEIKCEDLAEDLKNM